MATYNSPFCCYPCPPIEIRVPAVDGQNTFRTTWKPWLKPEGFLVFALRNRILPGSLCPHHPQTFVTPRQLSRARHPGHSHRLVLLGNPCEADCLGAGSGCVWCVVSLLKVRPSKFQLKMFFVFFNGVESLLYGYFEAERKLTIVGVPIKRDIHTFLSCC